MLSVLAASDQLSHVLPHDLFHIGPITVTNHMLMALVAAALMLAVFPTLFRNARGDVPHGTRNFFEAILEFLRTEVFRPALKGNTDRFVPFLWTLFFFILFCNLLGSIPFAEGISLAMGRIVHLGGTATGNINTTAALALCALLCIHGSGVVQVYRAMRSGTYGHHDHHAEPADHAGHGAEHAHGAPAGKAALLALPLYLWNFAPHPFKPKPGEPMAGWFADLPVWALLLILELLGAIIKPIALTIRLFANMIAGHIVLAALVGLIVSVPSVLGQVGVGVPLAAMSIMVRILELFVAFLQAYIFTFLTTLFIQAAVAPEH